MTTLLCARCGQPLAEHTDRTCSDLLHAEVERLREELNQCHSDAGFVIPALREALAAHQAVVRSLETALWRLIHSIWPCPEPKHGDECARCDAERRLADPLVVAARTEGRG